MTYHDDLLNEFEIKLDSAAQKVVHEAKTGYNWGTVDAILKSELRTELGDGETRCKKANNSGRAANVLTESNDKPIALYLIFIGAPYTIEKFIPAAINRMMRFSNVRTVAIANTDSAGTWRVRSILERSDSSLGESLLKHFPAVDLVHKVNVPDPQDNEDDRAPEDVSKPEVDILITASLQALTATSQVGGLLNLFKKFAAASSLDIDTTSAADVLATALSSQMILFAGASGTGKSFLAKTLAQFFTTSDQIQTLEAKRGWGSPEDVVGYYSALSDRFAQTPNTSTLTDLHEGSVDRLSHPNMSGCPPVLIIEEANLSTIEGYLANVIHGLSQPSSPYVFWSLHAQQEGATDTEAVLRLPSKLILGPDPRFFATINVDANSPAPARKITARSSVVLLGPPSGFDSVEIMTRLKLQQNDQVSTGIGAGSAYCGRPSIFREQQSDLTLSSILTELGQFLQDIGGDRVFVPSHRDTERIINYVCAYVRVVEDEEDLTRARKIEIACENAILHILLPQLPPAEFQRALANLSAMNLQAPSITKERIGGLLAPRIASLLQSSETELFSDSIDFWTALS